MPYLPHWRLVTRFDLGGSTAKEQASCTLNFRGSTLEVLDSQYQDVVNHCFTAWRTWTTNSNARVSTSTKLASCTLYQINADGRINRDPLHAVGTPATGTTDTQVHPWQCSIVLTLVAGVRGKGKFGRIYLPPQGYGLSSDGIVDSGALGPMFTATQTLMSSLSDAPGLDLGWGLVVAGQTGTEGTLREVTELRMGRVADTQRRRRRSLDEAYLTAPFTA